jgi:cupin fold WbuC family metalloprotein
VKLATIDSAVFARVLGEARASARRRKNYNFHGSDEENPHRFLNVLLKGTYIRPHRHSEPPKSETFLVLEGQAKFVIFDEHGNVIEQHELGDATGPRAWGIDCSPGTWHTIVALSDRAVCFEVKPGPWQPASDKEFAPWAPKEGDPSAEAYLQYLVELKLGGSGSP